MPERLVHGYGAPNWLHWPQRISPAAGLWALKVHVCLSPQKRAHQCFLRFLRGIERHR